MSAEKLNRAIKKFCAENQLIFSEELSSSLPKRWEKHGDMIMLPQACFNPELWNSLDQSKLWDLVADTLKVKRLARQTIITDDGYRTPKVVMLKGTSTTVTHIDNKIKYKFDVTKCMFSSGNITEKIRMSKLSCKDETIVDMFAGIGYFTLPLLVHGKAKYVYACEWNPNAAKALKENLIINKVSERCTVHQGDNREVCPTDIADRIILGLIPSAAASYKTACQALNQLEGGVMHIHGNVSSHANSVFPTPKETLHISSNETTCNKILKQQWMDWAIFTATQLLSILNICKDSGFKSQWSINILHIERVKSYAPHIDHIVIDLRCHPVAI
uniref:tRNA(Phe) (4-demethylwyosine(37)-C(7)) aminocarboxypropyltransferase n=1 Tax=Phallusia mammillata TaxID=59560 RepID=A0A6F9DVU8_9ASCI|nr:tRNA wybutosine-synthesizing protein 2 homolog [Phallusia mammillata]